MNPYEDAVNLYDYKGPTTKRMSVLSQIAEDLLDNPAVMLVGPRFSGKSTILDIKKNPSIGQMLPVGSACFVDLARQRTFNDVSSLASFLDERIEKAEEPRFDVTGKQSSGSYPVLLLLDNIHVLDYEILSEGLQELQNRYGDRIKFLCSIHKHKSRQITGMLSHVPQVVIGPLDISEIEELMDKGGVSTHVDSPQEKTNVATAIAEVSGGKPLFVNLICYFLVEVFLTKRGRNISPSGLPQSGDAMIMCLKSHRNESLLAATRHYLWSTLTERYERLVLLEIATKGPLKDTQLRHDLARTRYLDRPGLSQYWLNEALRRARDEGLIALKEDGKYVLAIPLIEYWLSASREPAAELDLKEWQNGRQIVLCW